MRTIYALFLSPAQPPSPPTAPPMDQINAEQKHAAELELHSSTSLLIVGGPGSGKTHTLAYRCALTLQHPHIHPENIMMLTFTRAAAQSMTSRICSMAGQDAKRIISGTFHSIANRLLHKNGFQFLILDEDAQREALLHVIQSVLTQIGDKHHYHYSATQIASFHRDLKKVMNAAGAGTLRRPNDTQRQVLAQYEHLKQQQGYFDFEDLLVHFLHFLRSEQATSLLRQIQRVFVDEVQDVNPLQLEIIRQFHRNGAQVTMIGDDAQSIYGFRGGTIAAIMRFEQLFPPATKLVLQRNYRNPAAVVEGAASIIQLNRNQLQRQTIAMKADHRQRIPVKQFPSVADEIQYVAQLAKTRATSSQFILARTHKYAQRMETELISHQVPYIRQHQVVDSRFIQVCCAILALSEHSSSISHWRTLCHTLSEGTEEVVDPPLTLLECHTYAPGDGTPSADQLFHTMAPVLPLLEQCGQATTVPDKWTCVVKNLQERGILSPTQDDMGSLRVVEALVASYQDIQGLLNDITDTQWNHSYTDDSGNLPVELMTVHHSKGLEADYTYIIGGHDHEFPKVMQGGSEEDMEEETRIAFVALTRAKCEVHISWATQHEAAKPSLFCKPKERQVSRYFTGDMFEQDASPMENLQ